MGMVVVARHRSRGPRVAIKVLNPALARTRAGLARFDREARAAARIRSPHVARVLDVGVTDARAPFLVMEYLEGSDLGAVLEGSGPLPLHEAIAYIVEACSGVAAAHDEGFVHRDLKPQNLFLTSHDGAPVIKVLDFGVSKLSQDNRTASVTTSCMLLGTPLYMAPEQFADPREVDVRADVWALGATLYELLTGRLPFEEQNAQRLYAVLITSQPSPPSALRPELPPAVDEVVMRCLRRDPEQRYQTVRQLAEALSALLPDGVESSVASLPPETARERLSCVSTLRPIVAPRWSQVDVGDERRAATLPPLRVGPRVPGGLIAWFAALTALLSVIAIFVVRGAAPGGEPSPIVVYAGAPGAVHAGVAPDLTPSDPTPGVVPALPAAPAPARTAPVPPAVTAGAATRGLRDSLSPSARDALAAAAARESARALTPARDARPARPRPPARPARPPRAH